MLSVKCRRSSEFTAFRCGAARLHEIQGSPKLGFTASEEPWLLRSWLPGSRTPGSTGSGKPPPLRSDPNTMLLAAQSPSIRCLPKAPELTPVPTPSDSIPHNLGTGCTQRLQDVRWAETTGIDVDECASSPSTPMKCSTGASSLPRSLPSGHRSCGRRSRSGRLRNLVNPGPARERDQRRIVLSVGAP